MRDQQLRLKTEPRVDWFQILVDLGRLRLSSYEIAQAIHVPKSTVSGWKQGAEPRHADGERLVLLWLRRMGRPRNTLPMTHRPPWLD